MTRIWTTAAGAVLIVAAVKTGLVAQFVLSPAQIDLPMVSGLFATFTVLTAGVAYVAFSQIRAHFEAKRKTRLEGWADNAASKETIIERCRVQWGLSQAETDVALFVAKGFSNSEIADMRGCAIATVKSQLGAIYQKSGLETRYQLMSFVADEVCEIAQELGQSRRHDNAEAVPAGVQAKTRAIFEMASAKSTRVPAMAEPPRMASRG